MVIELLKLELCTKAVHPPPMAFCSALRSPRAQRRDGCGNSSC